MCSGYILNPPVVKIGFCHKINSIRTNALSICLFYLFSDAFCNKNPFANAFQTSQAYLLTPLLNLMLIFFPLPMYK